MCPPEAPSCRRPCRPSSHASFAPSDGRARAPSLAMYRALRSPCGLPPSSSIDRSFLRVHVRRRLGHHHHHHHHVNVGGPVRGTRPRRVDACDMERDAPWAFGRRAPTSADRFVPSGGACDGNARVEATLPLAEQLRLRREQSDAEHQRRVQAMQRGAVRPLDVDEAAFLATCVDAGRRARREAFLQESRELEAYRHVRRRTTADPPCGIVHEGRGDSRRRIHPSSHVRVRPSVATVPLVAYRSSEEEEEDEEVEDEGGEEQQHEDEGGEEVEQQHEDEEDEEEQDEGGGA